MKKGLLAITAALVCLPAARAYDFEKDGIYYKILSPWERTVAVACGNTAERADNAPASGQFAPQRSMMAWDYLLWQGDSYSGDLTIPGNVERPGGEWYTVTQIDMGAFCYCPDLKSVQLPETLTRVCVGAFANCAGLEELILPDGITVVEDNAFIGCTGLKHVHFPLGCDVVNWMSFTGAGSPEGMEVSGTDNLRTIFMQSFNFSTLKKMPYCPNLKYVEFSAFDSTLLEEAEIPEGCIAGHSIFQNCGRLRQVTLPKGLENPLDLFRANSNLALIRYYEPVPPVVDKTDFFSNVNDECVLEVPADAVEAYKQAPVWKNFYEIRAIPGTESGVESVSTVQPRVVAVSGGIIVADASSVNVFTSAGSRVYSGTCGEVQLPAGLYIVQADGVSMKVAVR